MKNLINTVLPFLTEEVSVFSIKTKPNLGLDKLKEVSRDILLITSEIELKYPDLYKHLDETPITFSNVSKIEITISELENYLETLENQLCNYFNTQELDLKYRDFVF